MLVLVDCLPGSVPLDIDTVIFLDKGTKPLGRVFDVLGNINEPLYCVRFNSFNEITEKGIVIGSKVFVAPRTEHTKFIILANLMKNKGCDASWKHDVEIPNQCQEFSDDEDERSARKEKRGKKANVVKVEDDSNYANKRTRPVGGDGQYNNNGGGYQRQQQGPHHQNRFNRGGRGGQYNHTNHTQFRQQQHHHNQSNLPAYHFPNAMAGPPFNYSWHSNIQPGQSNFNFSAPLPPARNYPQHPYNNYQEPNFPPPNYPPPIYQPPNQHP